MTLIGRRVWLLAMTTLHGGCTEKQLECGFGTSLEGAQCVPKLVASGLSPDASNAASDDAGALVPSPLAEKYPQCVSDSFRGSPMVFRKTREGTGYCIEVTEVTQAQYQEFLADAPKPDEQIAVCLGEELVPPIGTCFTPEATPNAPMACISWCEATAYCRWAGKRLCGFTSRPDVSEGELLDDPNLNEWLNACTNRGQTLYSYGDEFIDGICPLEWEEPYEVGQPGCVDSKGEIFELSGGVSEFISYCSGNDSYGPCYSMGYFDFQPGRCDMPFSHMYVHGPAGPQVGLRCCADEVQLSAPGEQLKEDLR